MAAPVSVTRLACCKVIVTISPQRDRNVVRLIKRKRKIVPGVATAEEQNERISIMHRCYHTALFIFRSEPFHHNVLDMKLCR